MSEYDQCNASLRSQPGATGGSAPAEVWVTVLEFAHADAGGSFEVEQIENLIERLRTLNASGLCSPDRYMVQLQILADGPEQALERALAYHRDANVAAGFPPTSLVRVEVLTVEELERSWQEVTPMDPTGTPFPATSPICEELYAATRGLHAASTLGELTDILTRFVVSTGGRVEAGPPCHITGSIEFDLSLDGRHPRHATAEAFSVTGLVLEQSLPTLLADTREALARLAAQAVHNSDTDA